MFSCEALKLENSLFLTILSDGLSLYHYYYKTQKYRLGLLVYITNIGTICCCKSQMPWTCMHRLKIDRSYFSSLKKVGLSTVLRSLRDLCTESPARKPHLQKWHFNSKHNLSELGSSTRRNEDSPSREALLECTSLSLLRYWSSANEEPWCLNTGRSNIPVAVVPPQSRHPSEPSSITKGLLPDSIDHEFGVDAGSQLSLLKQSSVWLPGRQPREKHCFWCLSVESWNTSTRLSCYLDLVSLCCASRLCNFEE